MDAEEAERCRAEAPTPCPPPQAGEGELAEAVLQIVISSAYAAPGFLP
jgi:hypothetical protein